MSKQIASARLHRADLGEGIEIVEHTARLWQQGQIIAEAGIAEESPYDFWRQLKFREAFPQITHWRSGAVCETILQVDALQGEVGSGTFHGFLWMGDSDQAQLWEISSGSPVTVAVPTLANDPGDLLGQLALARAVVEVVNGERLIGARQEFSNLARRDESVEDDLPTLEEALPTAHQAWRAHLPLRFKSILKEGDPAGQLLIEHRLALEDAPDIALRKLLCERLGLVEPGPVSA